MIPVGDNLASRRPPRVTQGLIAANVLVFLYELTLRGAALDAFVQRWGAVPQQVLGALSGDPRVPHQEVLTLFTSQFIHAGFLHLGGNMLFLWVFGRSVEERLGRPLYLTFYLLAGAVAALVQSLVSGPSETVPMVGASGAIAGVLGLYFVTYPGAWVRVLMPVLFFFWAFDLPAVLVLGFWFVSQFFSGIAAITHASRVTTDVAIWAHVAGFVTGVICGVVLRAASGEGARPGVGAAAPRRADAPGPARLVSSVADLLALLLAARVVLLLFGLGSRGSPIAPLALPVLSVTEPIVNPLRDLLPTLRVAAGVVEMYTLVTILLVYLVAGLIGQVFVKEGRSRRA